MPPAAPSKVSPPDASSNSEGRLAHSMKPCNLWENDDAPIIPPRDKLLREQPSGPEHAWPDDEKPAVRSVSPLGKVFDPVWTSRQSVPDDMANVAMKPCNLWEGNQAPIVPHTSKLVREDVPTRPHGPKRQVSTGTSSNDSRSIPPTEVSQSSDEEDTDVVMIPFPAPQSKGIPSPFDMPPLTSTQKSFCEPPDIKEAEPPSLIDPEDPMRNNSILTGSSEGSFDDQPTLESDASLQEFMKLSEEHTLNLYVDDIQELTFDRIVESLYGNTTLRILTIVRSNAPAAGDYRTAKEMNCLWEAIKCLPSLKFLAVLNTREDVLSDLAEILPRFAGFKLQVHMAQGTLPPKFLKAMALAPRLKHVQLHVNASLEIAHLLESKSLQDFKVVSKKFTLEDYHVQVFADRLARDESPVQRIDLEPKLSPMSMAGLTYALRYNRTLQSLRVNYDNSLGDNNAIISDVANMLKYNRTLTELYNHSHDSIWVNGDTMDHLIKSMKSNRTIELFKFFKEPSMFWVAKEGILKANRNGEYRPAFGWAALFEKYYWGSCGSLKDVDIAGCGIGIPAR